MANPGVLSGSVGIVTGGTRGIGRGIAASLIKLGATAIITGRGKDGAQKAAEELGGPEGRCSGVACDVQDLKSVEMLRDHVRNVHGRVDILVNNAGIGAIAGALHELAPADWNSIFDTNVRGAFYMIRAFVPLMIESGGGQIINISSLAGKNPLPRGAAYSASKWALNGLSYSVAEELRPYNIRVSVVCPGSVNTEFSPHTGKAAERMLQPEDVAHAVEMLLTQQPQSFISEVLLRPTVKP